MFVFLFLIFSHWVYMNGIGRRYFIATYISITILVLLLSENLSLKRNYQAAFRWLLGSAVFVFAFSNLYHFKFVSPKSLTPAVKIVSELDSLGNIGIIAGYWSAYISAAANPEQVKATPNDKDAVRNFEMVEKVFLQEKLYIIMDNWLDVFPDTMHQFGRTLIKKGDQFSLANCEIANYKVVSP
jgi:hypothetical protein